VLLLDEPTSALDPKSSALVSQALEQASWNHLEPFKSSFFYAKKIQNLEICNSNQKKRNPKYCIYSYLQ
jgi:hypothetical protein